jgi:hypothetical protein
LQCIADEGGVLDHEVSKGLLDFWGKKDVAGIILMPAFSKNYFVHKIVYS